MSNKKTINFDFDGTIADTIPFLLEIINQLARENNFPELKQLEFIKAKSESPLQIIKKYKIPLYKIPGLLIRGQQLLGQKMGQVKFIRGMREILFKLKNKGYRFGILSSNSVANIKLFLQANKCPVFNFIHSEKNLFGKDKSLKNILKKYKLKKDDIVYVGDEVRDIEACRKAGIKIIAVAWGFNNKDLLFESCPDYMVDKPEDILKLL